MDRTIREQLEEREWNNLSPYAAKSSETRGRVRKEPECDMRTAFQRDRDRIIHCKAFRRLKHKTQVFLSPGDDHYRTRLTHTLEVAQIARTIARSLRLNEDLTEAIALGHDLGHTPFGHAGERALSRCSGRSFQHNEQSVRVVEKLEKKGAGLNLTWEVRDGILNHQTRTIPHTLEGKIVRLSDKIAYVNSDIDDAIRAMILDEEDIPVELRRTLGFTTRERLDHLIHDIISNSMGRNDIIMSDETAEALRDLRLFMFEHVYRNPVAKGEEVKAKAMLEQMYYFYMDHIEQLPAKLLKMLDEGEDKGRIVCDYISGMTDKYAITKFKENFMPQAWKVDGY
jgi:dGTPase